MNNWNLSPKQAKKLRIFCKRAGKGINRFRMIEDGDKILIGVSGGKDSLALSLALALRLFHVPIKYALSAVFIAWREYPLPEQSLAALQAFYRNLEIPFKIIEAYMFPPSFKGRFDCYLCARNKKRLLFNEAERQGIKKIALGHHLDDIIETTLMNIFFRGEFSTMMPIQTFFDGAVKIIRPLCEVTEKEVERAARLVTLPVISIACPNKDTNQRVIMKDVIARLSRINKKVRENIYGLPWRINEKYLPTCLHQNSK